MSAFLTRCRSHFIFVGLFSLCTNVLALALPLYMLQVYDRVLASRSEETLIMLTVITGLLLLAMTALEVVRSRVLIAVGVSLERSMATFKSANKINSGLYAASNSTPSQGPPINTSRMN